jgi:SPP1 gp7 family putative phage head morphogenesis protein
MRLTPPRTTKASEIEYYRSIVPIVNYINSQFKTLVMPKANEVLDGDLTILNTALKALTNKVNSKITNKLIQKIATDITNKIYKRNRTLWNKKLAGFGISIKGKESFKGEQEYIKSRIQTNVKLITNLKEEYLEGLEIDVAMAYEQGKTSSSLAEIISKKYGIEKRKAKLIARNEVKNTNTQLNNKQVAELGFDEVVWLTSGDERVRSEHRKHNRKKYKVGVGLPDGKGGMEEAGDAINCRCTFYIDI